MVKRNTVPAALCIGVGAMLGYAAASGHLSPVSKIGAAAENATTSAAPQAGCCDGLCKGELLAKADPTATQRGEQDEKPSASGKKPNIVFIMGDDVGWFNIGAYHRGIMSGRTPNLDKLAA